VDGGEEEGVGLAAAAGGGIGCTVVKVSVLKS
jgi:hypothetical protein